MSVQRRKILCAAASLLAFAALLLAGCAGSQLSARLSAGATVPPVAPTDSSVAPTATPRPSWKPSGAGNYLPLDTPIAGEKVTLQTARSRVPFTLPLPGYLPGEPTAAYLAEVWATSPGSEFSSLALVYGAGITIIVHQGPNPADWSNLSEPPFVSVRVSGNPGIGKDPGDEVLDDGSTWHYNGSVSWQAGAYQLSVYGEYPLSELLKVAESMEIRER